MKPPPPTASTPGEKLRALRENLGLSLRDAADRTGSLSYGAIRQLENRGDSWDRVELGSVRALARAYELPLWDLLQVIDQDDGVDPNDQLRHVVKRVELERSVTTGIAAVRTKMREVEEHLRALEDEMQKLRLR